jgi:uncharacterized protein YndB with AHSA1/START domain
MDGQTETASRELEITRIFDAPRSLLFKVWTEPEHMARWWGCNYMVTNKVTNDLRAGGAFRSEMTLEDGALHIVVGKYLEISAPERLSFTWGWEGGAMGTETVVTLTFKEQGDKTVMTFHQSLFDTADLCTAHNEGWNASFNRLSVLLADHAAD